MPCLGLELSVGVLTLTDLTTDTIHCQSLSLVMRRWRGGDPRPTAMTNSPGLNSVRAFV